MKKPGIYRISSEASGRHYVGSSQDVPRRWAIHRWALRHNRHHSEPLQRAWNKYGEGNFQFVVLEDCPVDELAAREQYWMEKLSSMSPHGYNVCPKAGSQRGYKMRASTVEKIRAAAIARGARPEEKAARSARAKLQHRQGKLGMATWKNPAGT